MYSTGKSIKTDQWPQIAILGLKCELGNNSNNSQVVMSHGRNQRVTGRIKILVHVIIKNFRCQICKETRRLLSNGKSAVFKYLGLLQLNLEKLRLRPLGAAQMSLILHNT